jgi:hypothetical protein
VGVHLVFCGQKLTTCPWSGKGALIWQVLACLQILGWRIVQALGLKFEHLKKNIDKFVQQTVSEGEILIVC